MDDMEDFDDFDKLLESIVPSSIIPNSSGDNPTKTDSSTSGQLEAKAAMNNDDVDDFFGFLDNPTSDTATKVGSATALGSSNDDQDFLAWLDDSSEKVPTSAGSEAAKLPTSETAMVGNAPSETSDRGESEHSVPKSPAATPKSVTSMAMKSAAKMESPDVAALAMAMAVPSPPSAAVDNFFDEMFGSGSGRSDGGFGTKMSSSGGNGECADATGAVPAIVAKTGASQASSEEQSSSDALSSSANLNDSGSSLSAAKAAAGTVKYSTNPPSNTESRVTSGIRPDSNSKTSSQSSSSGGGGSGDSEYEQELRTMTYASLPDISRLRALVFRAGYIPPQLRAQVWCLLLRGSCQEDDEASNYFPSGEEQLDGKETLETDCEALVNEAVARAPSLTPSATEHGSDSANKGSAGGSAGGSGVAGVLAHLDGRRAAELKGQLRDVLMLYCMRRSVEYNSVLCKLLCPLLLCSQPCSKGMAASSLYALASEFVPLVKLQASTAFEFAAAASHCWLRLLLSYHAPSLVQHLDRILPHWEQPAKDLSASQAAHYATALKRTSELDALEKELGLDLLDDMLPGSGGAAVGGTAGPGTGMIESAAPERSSTGAAAAGGGGSAGAPHRRSSRIAAIVSGESIPDSPLSASSGGSGHPGHSGQAQRVLTAAYGGVVDEAAGCIPTHWITGMFAGSLPPAQAAVMMDWAIVNNSKYAGLYYTTTLLVIFSQSLLKMNGPQVRQWFEEVAANKAFWYKMISVSVPQQEQKLHQKPPGAGAVASAAQSYGSDTSPSSGSVYAPSTWEAFTRGWLHATAALINSTPEAFHTALLQTEDWALLKANVQQHTENEAAHANALGLGLLGSLGGGSNHSSQDRGSSTHSNSSHNYRATGTGAGDSMAQGSGHGVALGAGSSVGGGGSVASTGSSHGTDSAADKPKGRKGANNGAAPPGKAVPSGIAFSAGSNHSGSNLDFDDDDDNDNDDDDDDDIMMDEEEFSFEPNEKKFGGSSALLGQFRKMKQRFKDGSAGKGGRGASSSNNSRMAQEMVLRGFMQCRMTSESSICLFSNVEEVIPCICSSRRRPASVQDIDVLHRFVRSAFHPLALAASPGARTDRLSAAVAAAVEAAAAAAVSSTSAASSAAAAAAAGFPMCFPVDMLPPSASTEPSGSKVSGATASAAGAVSTGTAQQQQQKRADMKPFFFSIDCRGEEEKTLGRLPKAYSIDPADLMDSEAIARLLEVVEPLRGSAHVCLIGAGEDFHRWTWGRKNPRARRRSLKRGLGDPPELQQILAENNSRLQSVAMLFLKKSFAHVSILDGGFASAVRFVHRVDSGLTLNVALVDSDRPTLEAFLGIPSSAAPKPTAWSFLENALNLHGPAASAAPANTTAAGTGAAGQGGAASGFMSVFGSLNKGNLSATSSGSATSSADSNSSSSGEVGAAGGVAPAGGATAGTAPPDAAKQMLNGWGKRLSMFGAASVDSIRKGVAAANTTAPTSGTPAGSTAGGASGCATGTTVSADAATANAAAQAASATITVQELPDTSGISISRTEKEREQALAIHKMAGLRKGDSVKISRQDLPGAILFPSMKYKEITPTQTALAAVAVTAEGAVTAESANGADDIEKKEKADGAASEELPPSVAGEKQPVQKQRVQVHRYLVVSRERFLVLDSNGGGVGSLATVKSNRHLTELTKMTFKKRDPELVTLYFLSSEERLKANQYRVSKRSEFVEALQKNMERFR